MNDESLLSVAVSGMLIGMMVGIFLLIRLGAIDAMLIDKSTMIDHVEPRVPSDSADYEIDKKCK